MKYSDINQVFTSTSSLTMASYFTEEDQSYLQSNYTLSNFPFGKSEKDVIEVTVFSFDGSVISSSYFIPSGTHIPVTKSYYDVTNKFVEYSYTSYRSDLVVVGNETKSVFFDVAAQLTDMNIQVGNYKLGLQLMRDIVGSGQDSKERLIVDTISPSRTEISVIPIGLRSDKVSVNDEFYAFSNKKVIIQDIADGLTSQISSPQLFSVYRVASTLDRVGASALKFDYGFSKDVDTINFLTDLYYGVKKGYRKANGQFSPNDILGIYDQFSNWLYQNYNSSETFQDIRDQYYSFFRYIIDFELNRLTNHKPDDYETVVQFLSKVYYDLIFFPAITNVESDYVNYISGYFKNFVNLGDGRLLPVMNTKINVSSDETFHDQLVIKLKDPLPMDVAKGYSFWITNTFASPPILQNIYFFEKTSINLYKMKGPNFLTRFENEGNGTETLSIEELIAETGSLYDELLSKLNTKNSSSTNNLVDYRYFENFVNFSSADLRIKAYDIKIGNLEQLQSNVQDLDAKLVLQPDDVFYSKEKQVAQTNINTIKASFDGYENFLYINPSWYAEHTNVYGGISSASLYDRENQNSLINNVPEFIVQDSQNDDYTKFVGMIGHYFDNLSLFIKQFTNKNDSSSSPNKGISIDLVNDALISLGWEPEISRENLPLLLGSFSKSDFPSDSPLYNLVGNISESDRNKLIWKRLLNSLPYIYKTKGTQASINAIISCFGVPKDLIKIKEYGGIDYTQNSVEGSLYRFEDVKYSPFFSGSGEYFQVPWTGSVDTIEFGLRFDTNKTSIEGKVFRLVSNDNNWVLGVYRDRGEVWGRVFLSIGDGTGSVMTSMTQKAPLFDGNYYTVALRKDDLNKAPGYPIEYELLVKKADQGRIVFSASSSFILSGSYNNVYESGSNIQFGNYQQSTASFGIDPEAFWGNLDEIKLWEIPLDNNSIEDHTLLQGGYNFSDPVKMVDNLLTRISFNKPIDLFTSSAVLPLNNVSFRGDFPTFYAVNFPVVSGLSSEFPECDIPDASPQYPYQFSIIDIFQSAKVSTYGSATMRSNKITYVNQKLSSNLSPSERSSEQSFNDSPVDSNKVGVFFSPIDAQNEEIMKFFGDYNFGDLIGDPALVYSKNYPEFEKFRNLYFREGFGIVDYQTFMNLVKSYFDKAMFKYIQTVVPARSKLMEGILIEPSILERPKIQMKPVVQEQIDPSLGKINFKETIRVKKVSSPSADIQLGHSGRAILNDINHRFYSDNPDPFSTGVFSDNGVTYYNGDYYRVDVNLVKKSYQVQRQYTLSGSQLNDYERNINLEGTIQTISRSYYQMSLIHLPTVTEHIVTASWRPPTEYSTYFEGELNIPLSASYGFLTASVSTPHEIWGTVKGEMNGFRNQEFVVVPGFINVPINFSASFNPGIYVKPITYTGWFDNGSGKNLFWGYMTLSAPTDFNPINSPMLNVTLISTGSIYSEMLLKTVPSGLFTDAKEIQNRKEKSLLVVPANRETFSGYFPTHYKYKKKTFSHKEINAYDQLSVPFKWKRGSQNKKTTVDSTTGNLNSSDPVETTTT